MTNSRGLFSLVALAAGLLLPTPTASAQDGSNCPPARPILSGPSSVQVGDKYTLTWSNVLMDQTGAADYYSVERSADPTFATGVERTKSTRPVVTLNPAPAGATTLYHRIVVASSCPSLSPGAIVSNVLTVKVTAYCEPPGPVGDIVVTPQNPPGLTTYVVSWDAGDSGPGPGGAPVGLKYRLRRTSTYDSRESVSDLGSASFTDPPGEYTYQVRAEASCGSVGPWSSPKVVAVGSALGSPIVLLQEAKTQVLAASLNASITSSFVIRNAGTASQEVTAVPPDGAKVSPASFSLSPGQQQSLEVTFDPPPPADVPVHAQVELRAGEAELKVPIDLLSGSAPAASPVQWDNVDADVDTAGDPVTRTITNPGPSPAAFVASIRQPWLRVESLDGGSWERPLQPGESRTLVVRVNRGLRRSGTGTEVGVVSLMTAGQAASPQNLVVTDDGPRLSYTTGVRPAPVGMKTRLLYASMPNARDSRGSGMFTSDVWLSNLDAVSPIDVSIFFTPFAGDGPAADSRRVDLVLAPGEMRRYRNLVGNVMGYEGAFAVEIRSTAPTLSATALVNNIPVTPLPADRRAAAASQSLSAIVPGKDFEMRPILPGEGVKAVDPVFVLSGLAHDARGTTNILLTETTGNDTTVRIELVQSDGNPVLKSGRPAVKEVVVPALSTVQINDPDLFDTAPLSGRPYANVYFESGYLDAFGTVRGAVVPLATVIDAGTGDAALRVGVSTKALTPLPPAASSTSGRAPLVGLPFGGGAAPLLFPVAHLAGARLASGLSPYWKTRVSFTNVSETEQRQLLLTFIDQSKDVPTTRTYGVGLSAKGTFSFDDILEEAFGLLIGDVAWGAVRIENVKNNDGSWRNTWADVDVQTELYTPDPANPARGDYKTGMEGFSYRHGYSSFQSNLGIVQIEGAETSSRYRTNLVLEEVGGASCQVAVSAYLPGSFVPIASTSVVLPPFGYVSRELFKGYLGLDLTELTDVRVVARQISGDGVFMAFASRINLATGGPANIFLRPASAGTGR